MPLDVLPIFLLQACAPQFTLLLVDEFYRLNGVEEEEVIIAERRISKTFGALEKVYQLKPEVIRCSEFMREKEYLSTFAECGEIITQSGLEAKVKETVPFSKRHSASALLYPVHELACVLYLARQGFDLKIGPSKENDYDSIMQTMVFPVDFAYLLDAYPIGTIHPTPIVHYVPTHYAADGSGGRIYFHDGERNVRQKIMQAPPLTINYLFDVVSVAAYIRTGRVLSREDFFHIPIHRQRKMLGDLVVEHIFHPYLGAIQ